MVTSDTGQVLESESESESRVRRRVTVTQGAKPGRRGAAADHESRVVTGARLQWLAWQPLVTRH